MSLPPPTHIHGGMEHTVKRAVVKPAWRPSWAAAMPVLSPAALAVAEHRAAWQRLRRPSRQEHIEANRLKREAHLKANANSHQKSLFKRLQAVTAKPRRSWIDLAAVHPERPSIEAKSVELLRGEHA